MTTIPKKQKIVDIEKLKWIYMNDCINSKLIWENAIKEENISILEWAKLERFEWEPCLFNTVCEKDSVKIAEWLFNNKFFFDAEIFLNNIAKHGSMNLLLWVVDNAELINSMFYRYGSIDKSIAKNVATACKNGHIEIVKWIIDKYTIYNYEQKELMNEAAKSNNLDLIKYLFEEKKFTFDKNQIVENASKSNNFEIIKYIYGKNDNHWGISYGIVSNLITNYRQRVDFFKILDWAIDSGCPKDGSELLLASKKDDIDLVKYLVNKNFINIWGCMNISGYASYNGNFELLQWLKDNLSEKQKTYEFDKLTCLMAAQGNQRYILSWLVKEGCEIDIRECKITLREHLYNENLDFKKLKAFTPKIYVIENLNPFNYDD